MTNLWQRLKQRKLVQWAIAYVAFAFALIQGVDVVAQQFGWPEGLRRGITLALVLGFFVVLVLAWYHGERGAQRVTGTELLIIALLLAVGGGVLWRYSRVPATPSDATVARTASDGRVVAANNKTSMSASVEAALVPTAATPIAMQPIPAKSIAVLPFDNLNVGKKDAYFVAGMQDLILTKLADIGDLKVISRTSTMQYGSHPQNLTIVGRQLGVATLLEGSVQKAGNQVLINVQLIDAQSDSHIWAQSYQRTLKNVFGVEGEVAEQIATALKAKLSPAVTQRLSTALTSNSAANDLYLRAEYFTNQGDTNYDTAPWKQAIPLYKQAIARAPDFALARARLSCVESDLAWFGGGGEDVQQLRADARLQAEQALALAPNLAEAHLAIGFSDYYGRGDYAGALIAFAAALRLRPNDAMALAARGFVLRRQGHFEAAIAALEQAFAHDPRNTAIANDLGETYLMVSRYAEAEVTLQHALALDPDNVQAKLQYSNAILYASGDVASALAAAQGDTPRLQSQRVSLLTYQRQYRAALALLAVIPDTSDNFSFISGSKAQKQADLYRLAGDAVRARALYEKALPLARAQLKAQAGNASNESQAWVNVADAELRLGHTAVGLAAIAQSQALAIRANDHVYGPGVMEINASLYAEAGRPDLAVPLLEKALATPGIGQSYSPVMLWLDPVWDPIRKDPRFQALLKKYANAEPSNVSSGAVQ